MIRPFISVAALFVKVIARIAINFCGDLVFIQILRYSFTRVKVLPEPAEALYILKGALFIRTSLRILDKRIDYEGVKIKNRRKE